MATRGQFSRKYSARKTRSNGELVGATVPEKHCRRKPNRGWEAGHQEGGEPRERSRDAMRNACDRVPECCGLHDHGGAVTRPPDRLPHSANPQTDDVLFTFAWSTFNDGTTLAQHPNSFHYGYDIYALHHRDPLPLQQHRVAPFPFPTQPEARLAGGSRICVGLCSARYRAWGSIQIAEVPTCNLVQRLKQSTVPG